MSVACTSASPAPLPINPSQPSATQATTPSPSELPPPIDVETSALEKKLPPASLLKRVLNEHGFQMQQIKTGYPKVLSPPTDQELTDPPKLAVEYYERGGKRLVKLPVVYEVVVERETQNADNETQKENVVLHISQEWFTNIELPDQLGGRIEENFHATVEAAFDRIGVELMLIGKLAKNSSAQRPISFFIMIRGAIEFGATSIVREGAATEGEPAPVLRFLGHRVRQLPTGIPLFVRGRDTRKIYGTGREEDNPNERVILGVKDTEFSGIHEPSGRTVYFPHRFHSELVLPEEFQERKALLTRLQEGNIDINEMEDPDSIIGLLEDQCHEYQDDLYGITADPQTTLEYYHEDMSPNNMQLSHTTALDAQLLAARLEEDFGKREGEAIQRDAKGRATINPPTIWLFKTKGPQRILYRKLRREIKSYSTMKERAEATLQHLQETSRKLGNNARLLRGTPIGEELEEKAAEVEAHLAALETYIRDSFPPLPPPPQSPQATQPQEEEAAATHSVAENTFQKLGEEASPSIAQES